MNKKILEIEAQMNRFDFGKNWSNFLRGINEQHIENSKSKLLNSLEFTDIKNKSFLDVGSGSGLSSLSASLAGAKVLSFDYDTFSVSSTKFLKNKYLPNNEHWKITQGSVLDKKFMQGLGQYDIVYSWGVLHHTGNMIEALKNVNENVKENGYLFIAIYNDQGVKSKIWKFLKKTYVDYKITRPFLIVLGYFLFWVPQLIKSLFSFSLFKFQRDYKKKRGMSIHHDIIDWMGGYPFEVASPDEIIEFYNNYGYRLKKLISCGGKLGCNEFIFQKIK